MRKTPARPIPAQYPLLAIKKFVGAALAEVVDKREDEGYVTPVECVGDYATYISRIRTDATVDNGLNMWVVSDNLRKGAALNAVQIAETLINKYLSKAA